MLQDIFPLSDLLKSKRCVAWAKGLEPISTVLETVMLPLHQADVLLRGRESNPRPSGYEPDALPLRYHTICIAKVYTFLIFTKIVYPLYIQN